MRATVALSFAAGMAILEGGRPSAPSRPQSAPRGGGCIHDLRNSGNAIPSSGGTAGFDVFANPDCEWTADPGLSPWIQLGTTSGTGNGRVTYSAGATSGRRQGDITIEGDSGLLVHHVTQVGPGECFYSFDDDRVDVAATGGAFPIPLTASPGCAWSSQAIAPWYTIVTGSGTGSGAMHLQVAPNPSAAARLTTLLLLGDTYSDTITLQQLGLPGCATALSRSAINVSSADQDISLGITAPASCSWTLEPDVGWITPQSPASGSGSAIVNLHASSNPGTAERTGSVLVGGLRFTVRQAGQGGCFYRFENPSFSIPADGDLVSVSVATNPGCRWSLFWRVDWIGGTTHGRGPLDAPLRFYPNSGAERGVRIDLRSEQHEDQLLATQAGGSTQCWQRFPQPQLSAIASAHTYVVPLAAPSGCTWTVLADASWVRPRFASLIGPSHLVVDVDANEGASREASIRFAGAPEDIRLNVVQAPAGECTYLVTPSEIIVPPDRSRFEVVTDSGCPWNVEKPVELAVAPISGTGSDELTVGEVSGNEELEVRAYPVTIAGHDVTAYFLGCTPPHGCPLYAVFCLAFPFFPPPSLEEVEPSIPKRLASAPFALLRFQSVRDEILRRSPAGRRAIALYEEHGAEIASLLLADPDLRGLALAAVEAWQDPLEELLEGRGAAAPVSLEMVATMDALLGELERLGSPGLRVDIAAERERVDFESWVGLPLMDALARFEQSACPNPGTTLCLQEGRFEATVSWRDPRGRTGEGHAVPLSSDTGAFWFFSPANVELVVKALDGRSINGNWWVFNGSLTNVEYTLTVRDTTTGQSRAYTNPLGQMGSFADTSAFPAGTAAPPEPTDPPAPDADAIELAGGRFRVEVAWRDLRGRSGTGRGVRLSSDSGYFWFFDRSNVELIVKVLDGRGLNLKWWVFYGALSNVEYTITVTDTLTGAVRQYVNPQGQLASAADTSAF